LSAYRIQQYWYKAIDTPTNPICQRRLKREYKLLFSKYVS